MIFIIKLEFYNGEKDSFCLLASDILEAIESATEKVEKINNVKEYTIEELK